MLLRRTLIQTRKALRGGLVSAAALALIAGAVGVPLPVGRPKDRSIPFPCMDRACGCHDAAECKAHCCCFSNTEKLVWAAEHGVDPQPFADDADVRFMAKTKASRAAENGNHSCCQKQAASCCLPAGGRINRSRGAAHARKLDPQPVKSDGLLSISAYRQCSGFGSLWSVLTAALAPAERARYEFDWFLTGRVAQQNAAAASPTFTPPTPPPRT